VKDVFPSVSAATAWRKVRSRATLEALGVDEDLIAAWRAVDDDGALRDEVKARFEGVPARYSHVIVDEAQDLTLFQLRAVQRRSDGLTLVGDDAQRSAPGGLGLRAVAAQLGAPLEQMATAYRMSAEIADWLNAHAARHHLDSVELLGVRPTGIEVASATDVAVAEAELRATWPHVAVIESSDVWSHKGVEYDAVVVDARGMTPAEIYLSASRAAHQLVVIGG
jgi:DNA helicase IV